MARGKRPDPFRTRKLSLSAPMVLLRRRGGRVGRRRTTTPGRGSEPRALTPVSVVHSHLLQRSACCTRSLGYADTHDSTATRRRRYRRTGTPRRPQRLRAGPSAGAWGRPARWFRGSWRAGFLAGTSSRRRPSRGQSRRWVAGASSRRRAAAASSRGWCCRSRGGRCALGPGLAGSSPAARRRREYRWAAQGVAGAPSAARRRLERRRTTSGPPGAPSAGRPSGDRANRLAGPASAGRPGAGRPPRVAGPPPTGRARA